VKTPGDNPPSPRGSGRPLELVELLELDADASPPPTVARRPSLAVPHAAAHALVTATRITAALRESTERTEDDGRRSIMIGARVHGAFPAVETGVPSRFARARGERRPGRPGQPTDRRGHPRCHMPRTPFGVAGARPRPSTRCAGHRWCGCACRVDLRAEAACACACPVALRAEAACACACPMGPASETRVTHARVPRTCGRAPRDRYACPRGPACGPA
jgi:hypothetical protein